VTFTSGKPMDIAPHPHIGLQTVSWLLDGELLHKDSLGLEGRARPGVLNLMTAGRGIAHSEETPTQNVGRLRGVQLWVALPGASRETTPAFEQHASLPVIELDGGAATVILGELGGVRSPGRIFSPMVGADISAAPERRLVLPLRPDFEHAIVPLRGDCRLEDRTLETDTLYYLGSGRRDLALFAGPEAARVLLLGGSPFGETILMWWNFVARTAEEIVAAREDWQAGRRFGEVRAYEGLPYPAPAFVAHPRAR
jgi:redox-sensitive bicupin YhaK (pirin superfamily)